MKYTNRRLAYIFGLTLIFLLSVTAYAQQTNIPITNRLSESRVQQSSEEEVEDLIKPSRPGIANPAEFQKPGVLQIEYGYDGNLRADKFRSQQTAPLTVRFAPHKRLLLYFNIDTVISEKDVMGMRETGVGITRIGV